MFVSLFSSVCLFVSLVSSVVETDISYDLKQRALISEMQAYSRLDDLAAPQTTLRFSSAIMAAVQQACARVQGEDKNAFWHVPATYEKCLTQLEDFVEHAVWAEMWVSETIQSFFAHMMTVNDDWQYGGVRVDDQLRACAVALEGVALEGRGTIPWLKKGRSLKHAEEKCDLVHLFAVAGSYWFYGKEAPDENYRQARLSCL